MSDWRERPVGSLKGVGSAMAEKLSHLGITTAGDLIRHYPRRYDDFSKIIPIRLMRPGNVTFRGTIERVASRYARGRKLHLTEAIITDGTGTVKAIWFNQPYLAKTIPTGTVVLVSGELKFKNADLALQSPAIEAADTDMPTKHTARIVPVYSQTEGLTSKQLRTFIQPLLPLVDTTPESLPQEVVDGAKLMPLSRALKEIHFPSSMTSLAKAKNRLAFEELWYLMLASLVIKHEIMTEEARAIEFSVEAAKHFIDALDFELTPHQKRAAWEIFQDMAKAMPMNRLLEGDVGSGKTAVAAMAAYMAMSAGAQVVLMVPTEVLARQHYTRLLTLFTKLGHEVLLLVGHQPTAEKTAVRKRLEGSEPALLIGTQALLQSEVSFANLALVIIDEQHRFGVSQRAQIKSKAGHLPHLLSMTATPIPRTLQLTVYGDLDISIIEGLPPGRRPITTRVIESNARDGAYSFINEQIKEGRQAFVVCPLINDSELVVARSATAEYERLVKGPFKDKKLGLLHGRLPADEKQAVMDAFVAGAIDILVATSVIEVGIDVPNATIMLIEGADRFGLAALHQLRGRIGRGEHASHCFVIGDSKSPIALERLKSLERTQDGFRLAQIDLELRGPGEIYGRRQHGTLDLTLADISDHKFLQTVRSSALQFLTKPGAMLEYEQVAAKVNELKSVTSLD